MEADWEVEIGPEAAVIDATWSGWIDLEHDPGRIEEITEASEFKPLADALLLLNAPMESAQTRSSLPRAVRTTKCDLWPVIGLDPDEMEATPASCVSGMAVYLDLLPRELQVFRDMPAAEIWARQLVMRLKRVPSPATRVDLVIRQAVTSNGEGLGITAYLTGCGATSLEASEALSRALRTFAKAVTQSANMASLPDLA